MYKNVKAEKSRPKNPGQKSWPKNPGQKSVCKITESFHLLVPLYSSGQSKKGSTILTYDSRVSLAVNQNFPIFDINLLCPFL